MSATVTGPETGGTSETGGTGGLVVNPIVNALRAGTVRGWSELRQTFTTMQDLWGYLFPTVIMLVVMFFMRGITVPGTNFSLSAQVLPSSIGMTVAFSGLLSVATQLVTEREDGTLLRVKSLPNGMLGYLVGKIVLTAGMTLVSCLLVLIPGSFIIPGLAAISPISLLMFLALTILGMIATMPIGAIIGSMFSSPRSIALATVPIMGMVAISGIFYPITQLPVWLQWLGQVFPMYWLGLGMRSAMLPDAMVAAEIGGSWRHLETVGVLLAWAIAGLIFAPIVLRRMARRESGSTMASRQERAMRRPVG